MADRCPHALTGAALVIALSLGVASANPFSAPAPPPPNEPGPPPLIEGLMPLPTPELEPTPPPPPAPSLEQRLRAALADLTPPSFTPTLTPPTISTPNPTTYTLHLSLPPLLTSLDAHRDLLTPDPQLLMRAYVTQRPLTLRSTLTTLTPRAIVRLGQHDLVLEPGDTFPDSTIRIASIERDHITLEHDGAHLRVALEGAP